MKALFRNMDLYKGIVLACLVLLPAAGGWTFWLRGQIEEGRQALQRATRPGGLLEEIGALQKQMELLIASQGSLTQIQEHVDFFDAQIISTSRGQLSQSDFRIGGANKGGSRRDRYQDFEVEIHFGERRGRNDKLALPRDFIFALIYNCESQSKVWKLRHLKIRNATDEKDLGDHRTPPPELEDNWHVDTLQFARREPDNARRR